VDAAATSALPANESSADWVRTSRTTAAATFTSFVASTSGSPSLRAVTAPQTPIPSSANVAAAMMIATHLS